MRLVGSARDDAKTRLLDLLAERPMLTNELVSASGRSPWMVRELLRETGLARERLVIQPIARKFAGFKRTRTTLWSLRDEGCSRREDTDGVLAVRP